MSFDRLKRAAISLFLLSIFIISSLFIPSTAQAAPGSDLIIDFGGNYGIWSRQSDATWTQLHGMSPVKMTTGDIDGDGVDEVIADFVDNTGNSLGIWSKSAIGNWQKVISLKPRFMATGDLDGNGFDEVVADFVTSTGVPIGIWARYHYSTGPPTWKKLHGLSTAHLAAGDIDGNGADEIVADFPCCGIWSRADGQLWSKVHYMHSNHLVIGDLDGNNVDDIIGDFVYGGTGRGIWARYNSATGPGSWAKLQSETLTTSSLTIGNFDGTGGDDLAAHFIDSAGRPLGIFQRLNNGVWSHLSSFNPPEFMTAGDLDGGGADELVVDFGVKASTGKTLGIWSRFNGSTWTRLHPLNPDAMAITAVPGLKSGSIVVTPSTPFKLALGGKIALKAQVFDQNGSLVFNTAANPVVVTWSSSNDLVAGVDASGVVTGTGMGTATITARTGTLTTTVAVNVQFSNMSHINISPKRLSLDVGTSRLLDVSATDQYGTPTTLDCLGSPSLQFDTTYINASYQNTLGAEKVDIQGLQKGFSLLTLDCAGFKSSPAIVEVKPSVFIPNPSPSSSADFGIDPSLAIDASNRIHISSYDRTNGKLIYTSFQGAWRSEALLGSGNYGRDSQVLLDPLNGDRPMVCAVEGSFLSCWLQNGFGFWDKRQIEQITPSVTTYGGEVSAVVNSLGVIDILYFDEQENALKLATSTSASRNDWTTSVVSRGSASGKYNAITNGPDDTPRIAFQHGHEVYYGSLSSSGTWNFELIDGTAGTPAPGTGIRLAVGTDNRPQVVYYSNGNMVHAMKIAGNWYPSVIETVNMGGNYDFGFGLNMYNKPRVSYYDAGAGTMRYAYKEFSIMTGRDEWQVDTPSVGASVGQYSDLKIDQYDRAHLAYYDSGNREVKYFVEPHFLNYTAVDAADVDTFANTIANPFINNIPTGVTATADYTDITVSWAPVAGATSYRVYYNATGGVTTADSFVTAGGTGYTFTNPGTGTHYFKVMALQNGGWMGTYETYLSAEVSSALTPIPAPTGVTASSTYLDITVNWAAVSGINTYRVYYSTTAGVTIADPFVTVTADTSQTFTTPGTGTFYYAVSAVAGPYASPLSAETSSALQPIPAPTGVAATPTYTDITVSWAAVSGATSYKVYYNATGGVTTTDPFVTVTSGTGHTFATPGTGIFYYRVSAVINPYESVLSGQTSSALVPVLAPTGVTATPTYTDITINWAAVSGATSYKVYYNDTGGVTTADYYKTVTTGTSHTFVSPGTGTLYYAVSAVAGPYEGSLSAQGSTALLPIPAPTGVTATSTYTDITVSWAAVSGATSYRVYYNDTGGVTTADPYETVTSGTSQTFSSPGTGTFYYAVTALAGPYEGSLSAEGSTALLPVPAPTGVTATSTYTDITVGWAAVSGATSYRVYYNDTGSVTTADPFVTVTAGTSRSFATFAPGTYYFAVSALVGAYGSPLSEQTSSVLTLVPAPTGVMATPNYTNIEVSWTALTGVDTYRIYYNTTGGVTKADPFITTYGTSHTFNNPGTDTTYFAVSAFVTTRDDEEMSIEVSAKGSVVTDVRTNSNGASQRFSLLSNGSVWGKGPNVYGELCDGTRTSRNVPVQAKDLVNLRAISLGGWHTLAVKSDGSVWGCGDNTYGQLGDSNTAGTRTIPVQINSITSVIAIETMTFHSIALKTNGTVWAWGYNGFGQLGDGTTTQRFNPVQVSGLTNVQSIAAGYSHSLAVKTDGTAWAWGLNQHGQLGDGTQTQRNTPVQVNGLTNVTAISAGIDYSLALKADGTVWAWGYNYYGQLGDGTTIHRFTPVQVNGLTNVTAIVAGAGSAFALKNDGTVWAWGANGSGSLGDGTTTNRYIPVQVNSLTGINSIDVCIAMKNDGTIWEWGPNRGNTPRLGR